MRMVDPNAQDRKIRYTLLCSSGFSYELTCSVRVRTDTELGTAYVVFQPMPGQFRTSAIGVLLSDICVIYLELVDQVSESRLNDVVVLELADPIEDDDITWMGQQAWLLGVDLVVRRPPVL